MSPMKEAQLAVKRKGVALAKISIQGFKSLKNAVEIEIKPITILAGANSSGKSALVQPLLLLKQTLHSHFDLGPLKIDGPNVFFRNSDEMFWREPGEEGTEFSIKLELSGAERIRANLSRRLPQSIPTFDIFAASFLKKRSSGGGPSLSLSKVEWLSSWNRDMKIEIDTKTNRVSLSDELVKLISKEILGMLLRRRQLIRRLDPSEYLNAEGKPIPGIEIREIKKDHGIIKVDAILPKIGSVSFHMSMTPIVNKFIAYADIDLEIKGKNKPDFFYFPYPLVLPNQTNINLVSSSIRNLIHLPGLRGNPKRLYPVRDVEKEYSGLFNEYAASLIRKWQVQKSKKNLEELKKYLRTLRISWGIKAYRESDAEIKLLLGRTTEGVRGGAKDYVNIADTGLGASQVLPILVALIAAKPRQLLYIEQPELHLHPNAQVALADLIVKNAVSKDVHFIIETHSMYMLMAIQRAIATGDIPHEDVVLHWFARDKKGVTEVISTDFESDGAYTRGDAIPEDFSSIAMKLIQDIALAHVTP